MGSVHLFQKDRIVETSWDAIKRNQEMISTGDYIPFALKNGEEVAVRAMHDGVGKLFFVLENCLGEEHCINPADNEKGDWETCEMRKYLNKDIFALLPDNLQGAIAQTEILETGLDSGKTKKLKDKLFLLSHEQVFGGGNYNTPAIYDQLDWLQDVTHRIKLDSNGNPTWWWLRTAYFYHSFYGLTLPHLTEWDSRVSDRSLHERGLTQSHRALGSGVSRPTVNRFNGYAGTHSERMPST